jgi:alcohol dehydrogenase
MKTRAALLEAPGRPLQIVELDLAPPGPREVLVRLHASGVCHSDLSVIDGTIESRVPCVLGHEGAGVVAAVGPEVTDLAPGDHVILSWNPACGVCSECVRGLPQLCRASWPAMFAGGLLDGTSRLSQDGRPIHHYSLISSFSEWAVVAERSCVPIPDDVPLELAALVGCAVTTGIGAVWNTAQARPGDRIAVLGCGGVGASAIMAAAALGAHPVIAVDLRADKLALALTLGATDTLAWQGSPEATAEALRELSGGGLDYAIDAVGRPEVALAAFLSTRGRGAAVVIGIPDERAVLELPLITIPRLERRVLGSIYGSASPARDFRLILDLYRAGRLPLDRLVSHRFPLEGVGEAMELIRSGEALRSVLVLAPD